MYFSLCSLEHPHCLNQSICYVAKWSQKSSLCKKSSAGVVCSFFPLSITFWRITFHFMGMSVLPACTNVHHLRAVPLRAEEDIRCSRTETPKVVSCREGARIRDTTVCSSSKCSYLPSRLSSPHCVFSTMATWMHNMTLNKMPHQLSGIVEKWMISSGYEDWDVFGVCDIFL